MKKLIKLTIWCSIFFFIGRATTPTIREIRTVEVPVEIEVKAIEATPTPIPTEKELLIAEIREVFADHADDALKLLTAKECHENLSLDPKAININDDELHSRDLGLFQINEYWQGFRHQGKADQFLLDPHINIRIAWRIYEDNNYSFSQWTCGRELGI